MTRIKEIASATPKIFVKYHVGLLYNKYIQVKVVDIGVEKGGGALLFNFQFLKVNFCGERVDCATLVLHPLSKFATGL